MNAHFHTGSYSESVPQDSKQRNDPSRNPYRTTPLPAELLSYMFILSSYLDPLLPLTVSHVCRSWRALALHTPTLWRSIHLDSRLRLWVEYIRRSRSCTLDLLLSSESAGAPGSRISRRHYLDAQSVQYFMHSVAASIPQWRTLTIDFEHYAPYLWNAALSACCGHSRSVHAPHLQSMTLLYPHNDDTKEFTLFGGYAPRLNRMTLHGIRLTWLPSLYGNLMFLDYTHHGFTRGYNAASELLTMLQVSSRIHELRVSFPTRQGTQDLPSTLVPPVPKDASYLLADLHTLELRIDGADIGSALIHFISHISTPSLRTLRLLSLSRGSHVHRVISSSSHRSPDLSTRLQQLLKALPRLFTVTSLEIEHIWLSDPRFIFSILYLLPKLDHLIVRGSHVTDPFILDLSEVIQSRARSMSPYWIRQGVGIDVLELDGCDCISGEAVADAVQHRFGGYSEAPAIKKVYIKNCPGVAISALRRSRYYGIEVTCWQKGLEADSDARRRLRSPHR